MKFSEQELQIIATSYGQFEGNQLKAYYYLREEGILSKRHKVIHLVNTWKRQNFEIKSLRQEMDSSILSVYWACDGNSNEAKRRLSGTGIFPERSPSVSYIRKVWKEADLVSATHGGKRVSINSNSNGGGRTSFSDLERINVLFAYYNFGGNRYLAGKQGSYSCNAYHRNWKKYETYLKNEKPEVWDKLGIQEGEHFERRPPTKEELEEINQFIGIEEEEMILPDCIDSLIISKEDLWLE